MSTTKAGVVSIDSKDSSKVQVLLDPKKNHDFLNDFLKVGEIVEFVDFLGLVNKSGQGEIVLDAYKNSYISIEMDRGFVLQNDQNQKIKPILTDVHVGQNLLETSKNGIEIYAFDTTTNIFYSISELDSEKEVIKEIKLKVPIGDRVMQICPGDFQIVLCLTRYGHVFALDTHDEKIRVTHTEKIDLKGMYISVASITTNNDYLIVSCYKISQGGIGILFAPPAQTILKAYEILENTLELRAEVELPKAKG